MPTTTKHRPNARENWAKARRAEIQYGAQLRKIARHIGDLISGFDLTDVFSVNELATVLRQYADRLDPWARSAARRMVAEVAARNDKQWRSVSAEMGRSFRQEFESGASDIGFRYHQLMDQQITLIKSIPLEAAERVHKVTSEGIIEGARFTEIAKRIQEGGEVSKSKATLIARTETGRAATLLTQARAESIGSLGYIWRTMKDRDVRQSHKAMEGRFVAWDDPPTLDGLTGAPGCVPNCRCYPEPVLAQ